MHRLLSRFLPALATGLSLLPAAAAQRPLTQNTLTADAGAAAPKARIADVGWLTGRWTGTGLGGVLEETWAPPLAGAMVATFRLVRDDRPSFYEICLLAEQDGTLVYKVKHFHADLRGWEEKDDYVTFPLVKLADDAVYFRGLTLKREGNRCTQYLAMRQKDGGYKEVTLRYARAARPPRTDAVEPAATDAELDGALAGLKPLLGAWRPADQPDRVVHDYRWTVGRKAMRLREGYAGDAGEAAELDGLVHADPISGGIRFTAVAGRGPGQGRLFRGRYRVLDDGRIERVYTVAYRTRQDTPGEQLGGHTRRFREIYTVSGDRLDATLEWHRDGKWQPFAVGKYSLVRRTD